MLKMSDHDAILPDEQQQDAARKRRNPFNKQHLKEEKERRQKKRARLIVRNLSYKITEPQLRQHFEQWGSLEDINLLKRSDGKLVGCAFVQYASINQATKAILKSNNQALLGRTIFVDWALGKDDYVAKKKQQQQQHAEPAEKKAKVEIKDEDENDGDEQENEHKQQSDASNNEQQNSEGSDDEQSEVEEDDENDETDDSQESADNDSEAESANSDVDTAEEADDDDDNDDKDNEDDNDDDDDKKNKKSIDKALKKQKHISNDVQEGCTIFIKNVPFDAEDEDLRKVVRKFGPVYYVIINREPISGHSKGTAFVKFKTKESADLCLQAGAEFLLMDEIMQAFPALSRDEVLHRKEARDKDEIKDSRNLYLVREGLIMSGSKAAEGVSAADMAKRHKLEQVKTQVLKNLNRFVSRNRLSIHNLPLHYNNEKLKQMAMKHTGFRPHECRVMRENQISAEHPEGKSKGFGFLSFSTHEQALNALRKLNNNPLIFGAQHRPIVAFSIEDRAVHKIKEQRKEKSKLNNPTYKEKLEKRKLLRQQKRHGLLAGKFPKPPAADDKQRMQKHIKKLEKTRAAQAANNAKVTQKLEFDNYVGTAAQPGTAIRMRSNKKIKEQSQEHMKRVKASKRKEKQQRIKQAHLAERKADNRPKQGRKIERDELMPLVNKYKQMLEQSNGSNFTALKTKKPKRSKWYAD